MRSTTMPGFHHQRSLWSVRAAKDLAYPPPALKNIVVGLQGMEPRFADERAVVEVINPSEIEPKNLFRAQLEKRIGVAKAKAFWELVACIL